jgi:hypothetical protein
MIQGQTTARPRAANLTRGDRAVKHKIILALLVSSAAVSFLAAQTASSEAPSLTIYPAFHVKFSRDGGNYLLASTILMNVSGHSIRDLTFTQTFPKDLIPAEAQEGIHEYFRRPEGFEEKIEGQTYQMKVPILRRREVTAAFVVLNYKGRPSRTVVPESTIEYSVTDAARTQSGPPLNLELKKVTKYSGSLSDYLKRYAGMVLTFPEEADADWGFSSLASRMRGKTPIGMVEIDGDSSEGQFSLLSGAPGNSRAIVISWQPAEKAKPAGNDEEVRRLITRQTFGSSDFTTDMEQATIEKVPMARGEAWTLTSRWVDRVANRLGEGPIRWFVYTDPSRETQYVIMIGAQGRGAGPGKADVANEDGEAALMRELEEIVKSFRPV